MEKLCLWDNFSNVEYPDLCATITPSKIKDLEEQKQSLKHLCNINLIGFLEKPGLIDFVFKKAILNIQWVSQVKILNQKSCILIYVKPRESELSVILQEESHTK